VTDWDIHTLSKKLGLQTPVCKMFCFSMAPKNKKVLMNKLFIIIHYYSLLFHVALYNAG